MSAEPTTAQAPASTPPRPASGFRLDIQGLRAVAVLTVALTLGLMLTTLAFARRLPQGVLPWRD